MRQPSRRRIESIAWDLGALSRRPAILLAFVLGLVSGFGIGAAVFA